MRGERRGDGNAPALTLIETAPSSVYQKKPATNKRVPLCRRSVSTFGALCGISDAVGNKRGLIRGTEPLTVPEARGATWTGTNCSATAAVQIQDHCRTALKHSELYVANVLVQDLDVAPIGERCKHLVRHPAVPQKNNWRPHLNAP